MPCKQSYEEKKLAPLLALGANFSKRSYYSDYISPDGVTVIIVEQHSQSQPELDGFYYRFYKELELARSQMLTQLLHVDELPGFIFDMKYLGYFQDNELY